MKTKALLTIVSIVVVTFTLSLACNSIGAEEKPIELRLGHFWPASHYVQTEQVSGWVKEIEAATKGRLKIVTYPGQTLVKMKDTFDAVLDGTVDIGMSAFHQAYGRYPLLEVFELPTLVYSNATSASVAAWEGIKQIEALAVADVKLVYLQCTGPGMLGTMSPVRKMEDLKNMRVQGTGSTAVCVTALGGIPVGLPAPDLYLALKKGTINAVTGPPELLEGFKLGEVTKYVTLFDGVYNKVHYVAMNRKKYESLPEDIRKAFDQVNDTWSMKAGKIWTTNQQAGLDFAKSKGAEIIRLSPEENTRWIKTLQPITEKFIADAGAKGLQGKEIVNKVNTLVLKYNEMYK
jgi:TRAP-type C4-dicarboxylate transport system substrate-binding protein